MDTTIAGANGKAGSITLGGREFSIARLRMKDIGEYNAYVAQKMKELPDPVDTAKSSFGGLTPSERQCILQLAFERKMQRNVPNSLERLQVTEGQDVAALMIWLSIRREYPDVTKEQVKEWVADGEIDDIQDVIQRINGRVESRDEWTNRFWTAAKRQYPDLALETVKQWTMEADVGSVEAAAGNPT